MATTLSPLRTPDPVAGARPAARRGLPAGPPRQALAAALLLLLWQALSTWVFDPSLVPSPVTVLGRALELTVGGELPRHAATSLARVLVGYVTGAVLGTAFGLAMGAWPGVERLVNPSLGFIRSIPPIAFVPFSIILFGIGEASKYAIIVYLVFIVLALNAAAGVRETPRIRIRAAQALGASGLTVLTRVILPSAFPFILSGLRVAVSLAFMAVVSAELIGARAGLGYLIMESRTMLETDKMLVGILSLGLLGALLDRGADLAIHRAFGRFTRGAA